MPENRNPIELTVAIVAAYVSHNRLAAVALPEMLTSVHEALIGLVRPSASLKESSTAAEALTPVQVRQTITPDALISFIDGRPYKTLKRHLTAHGLGPHDYRQRYGLPTDYPMVCPSYSARRSQIARESMLGVPQVHRRPRAATTSAR